MNRSARTMRTAATVAVSLIATGCTTATLKPAAIAERPAGQEAAAVGRSAQVEMIVETDAWSGFPPSLQNRVTPLLATIVNRSDHAVEVKYEHFTLSGFDGVSYHPLPPLHIEGVVTETAWYPIYVPRFAHYGYVVAPYYHPCFDPYFSNFGPWVYRPLNPLYYDRYYPRWAVDLPTKDMIEAAIPEGVIQPHGRVSGFLFFPELEAADEGDRVTSTANLVDAKQEDPFGRIAIPFVFE